MPTKIILTFALLLGFALNASAADVKEWTFLVYLNGNNNLDSFGTMNINEMEQFGSSDQVNVVVQWASMRSQVTKRLLVQKDSSTTVTSPVVESLSNVDMGDYHSLIEFARWAA